MQQKPRLHIEGLKVRVGEKIVLDGVELGVNGGEVVALMGPNGSGKTSIAQTIMGNPKYEVLGGVLEYEGNNLGELSVFERVHRGIFVSWQSPVSIPGVSGLAFLRSIYEATGHKITSMVEFRDRVKQLAVKVGLKEEVINRAINEGFSGGEKRRFELLQAMLLAPRLVVLDEIDSGLDVDGLKMVGGVVEELARNGVAVVIITHYKKMLDFVKVAKVVVIAGGKTTSQGGRELVEMIDQNGYARVV